MALKIGKLAWQEIRRHGEETYPHECCGVLLGDAGDEGVKVVQQVVRCDNQRSDSLHNRYLIDPRELVRIHREARKLDQDIVGFYHSHPDHPARWSQTDLAEAHWTGCSYVITSVMKGSSTETNSFTLSGNPAEDENKYFEDEEIRVE
jgi:proteasome lid subunit RPN8/RPN11